MSYSIKDLELLSGIKAHTLRIWEKRYSVLTPQRSDTNIREYGDEDLRRLLNVTTLLNNGWKISKASALSQDALQQEVEDIFEHTSTQSEEYSSHINALTLSMMEFDEARFEQVFASALLLMGLKETMLNIIYPFLSKVGLMWSVWKAHPGQEHFASNLIRKKLFSAIDQLPVFPTQNENFLLFLPEGEQHEIGLLFANHLLRSRGYKVYYLGQDVPFESLQSSIETLHPDNLLTFFIRHQPKEDIQDYLKLLSETYGQTKIHVAGVQILQFSSAPFTNILLHKNPSDLLNLF